MITQNSVLTNLNAGRVEEMTSSFSNPLPVFCLAWKFRDKYSSVWVRDIKKAIEMYFTMKSRKQKIELYYFPGENSKFIKVF